MDVHPLRSEDKQGWLVMAKSSQPGGITFFHLTLGDDGKTYDTGKVILNIDYGTGHADFFYIDQYAENPYGVIQCNESKDMRFFFFDEQAMKVTKWSGNMYASDNISKLDTIDDQLVHFLQLDPLSNAYLLYLDDSRSSKIYVQYQAIHSGKYVSSLSHNSVEDYFATASP